MPTAPISVSAALLGLLALASGSAAFLLQPAAKQPAPSRLAAHSHLQAALQMMGPSGSGSGGGRTGGGACGVCVCLWYLIRTSYG